MRGGIKGAIVLGSHKVLSRIQRIQTQGIALRDLQSRTLVFTCAGSSPTKDPSIVGDEKVPIGQKGQIVLVCMGVQCLVGPLPMQRTIPVDAAVVALPHIHTAHHHVLRILGIDLQAQIPEGLPSKISARNGVTEHVGTAVPGGERLPRQPCIGASPKAKKILLEVMPCDGVYGVSCARLPKTLCRHLDPSNACKVFWEDDFSPSLACIDCSQNPHILHGQHRDAVRHPNKIADIARRTKIEGGSAVF